MNELNINMRSESELQELLDIRTQITRLQKRYDEIMSGARSTAPARATTPAQPQPLAELPPQPYQAAPASTVTAPHTPAAAPVTARPSATARSISTPSFTPSRPQAPRPAPVSAKPVTPSTATRSMAAASTQKTEDADKIKVDSAISANVRQALVQILTTAAKPLPFNTIYSKLQDAGVQLPESKPMLIVRKLLYDKDLFDVVKGGMFQIRADMEAIDTVAATYQTPEAAENDTAPAQPDSGQPPQQPIPAPVYASTQPQQPKQSTSFNARLNAILNQ